MFVFFWSSDSEIRAAESFPPSRGQQLVSPVGGAAATGEQVALRVEQVKFPAGWRGAPPRLTEQLWALCSSPEEDKTRTDGPGPSTDQSLQEHGRSQEVGPFFFFFSQNSDSKSSVLWV